MQRWHPEKHDSEERWPVSGLNQDESQEIWFNECPTIIRHFETVRGFGTKITTSCWYTSWYIHHLLQRPIIMAERMRFNFITFCKRSKYISRRWHSFFRSSLLLLQRAYQTFPENRDRVVFLYLIFLIHTDLFSIFLIFLGSPKSRGGSPSYCWSCKKKRVLFL